MTVTEDSSGGDFSLRRRSFLLAAAGGTAVATLGAAGIATAPRAEAADPPFDFDNGNFIRDLFHNAELRGALDVIGPMDATVLLWGSHKTQSAWFDAIAPYHPTAVGMYSRIPRRPASESVTNRNKNIAALHAMYQVLKGVIPERVNFRKLLEYVGLNPDDESSDLTTPVGIGNTAGKAIVKYAQTDGMNMLGYIGRKYNPIPFRDYTNYRPVNSAFELVNPSRWQPLLGTHHRRLGPPATGTGDKGIMIIQQFVTPHIRLTKPVTYTDPGQFKLPAPDFSDHTKPAYKRAVDEVLAASANLTDEQKVMAEIFDDKALGLAKAVHHIARAHDAELGLDGWVHLFATAVVANYDWTVAAWHHKWVYDAVRPVSAIRHVYGNSPVTAWGGPGKGRVTDIPANEWKSYLGTGDHPEYPSGSAGLCSAEAQALRRFFGTDTLNFTVDVPAGWNIVEPGVSPSKAITLHWDTWTQFVNDCAMSRLWGGVHFKKTAERTVEFGKQFGDLAYEHVQRHIKGQV